MTARSAADSGWGRRSADRWVFPAMDTVFSFVIPGLAARPDADRTATALAAELGRIEAELSVFDADSEVTRWRAGTDAAPSSDLLAVIADCERLEARTHGAFSAGRGPTFDPTGYVKGWALRRLAGLLDSRGLDSYCLNGGGDVVVRGRRADGSPWRVGVSHPRRAGELATVITAPSGWDAQLAVATSGVGERGRHIAHPATGWRPMHSSVTVVGDDIAVADALATAALAVGEEGPGASGRLVTRLGFEAFGFAETGDPWWTPGMPRFAALPA